MLVLVDGMDEAQSTATKLQELGYTTNTTIDASDVEAGFIKVELAGNTNAGTAADALNAQGILAQPNFYYYLLDEEEDSTSSSSSTTSSSASGASGSSSASSAASASPSQPSSASTDPAASNTGSDTVEAMTDTIVEEAAANGNIEIEEYAEEEPLTTTSEPTLLGLLNEQPLGAQAVSIDDPESNQKTNWLTMVNAYSAWETTKTEKRVTVAVIDSGCNVNHEDLKDNIVGQYDTQTGGTSASDVADEKNHGTHVAGIISAKANNGKGVAGVSYNAGLYIIRAMHESNGKYVAESSDVTKAYQNIIDNQEKHHIRVVNMSLGTKRTGSLTANDAAVMNKINDAYTKNGILTVCAAGNRDGSVPYRCYVCDFSNTLFGVINLIKDGSKIVRNENSNYNLTGERTKDLGAPGGGNGSSIISTVADGSYTGMFGTSMASPVAAGIAALVFAANQTMTPAQVSSVICSSATDLTPVNSSTDTKTGFDASTGYGLINADKAVKMAVAGKFVNGADSIAKGTSTKLECTGASNWQSDDTSVATVNAKTGVVTGNKGGYATICATCNGDTVTKTIAVYDASITGTSTVKRGSQSTYNVSNTPNGTWIFSTDKASVATITSNGVLTARSKGTVEVTAKLSSNPGIQIHRSVTVSDTSSSGASSSGSSSGESSSGGSSSGGGSSYTATSVPMYRLYNPNSGEHFYTKDSVERDNLVSAGWYYEGKGWMAPQKSNTPVYRLYNAYGGEHHYTMDSSERSNLVSLGWSDEGIGWYSDDNKGQVLYREYNPNAYANNHNYTADWSEHAMLMDAGWQDEGYAWYGVKSS